MGFLIPPHHLKSFEIPEEIKKYIGNKNIIANIFRVQANNSVSVMCGYFCRGLLILC